jgi:hypothetical protein
LTGNGAKPTVVLTQLGSMSVAPLVPHFEQRWIAAASGCLYAFDLPFLDSAALIKLIAKPTTGANLSRCAGSPSGQPGQSHELTYSITVWILADVRVGQSVRRAAVVVRVVTVKAAKARVMMAVAFGVTAMEATPGSEMLASAIKATTAVIAALKTTTAAIAAIKATTTAVKTATAYKSAAAAPMPAAPTATSGGGYCPGSDCHKRYYQRGYCAGGFSLERHLHSYFSCLI